MMAYVLCKNKCGYTEKSTNKEKKNKCIEISFMVFRTGSILIVGHCNEEVLNIVYEYLKCILLKEYPRICNNDTIYDLDEKIKPKSNVKKEKQYHLLKSQFTNLLFDIVISLSKLNNLFFISFLSIGVLLYLFKNKYKISNLFFISMFNRFIIYSNSL